MTGCNASTGQTTSYVRAQSVKPLTNGSEIVVVSVNCFFHGFVHMWHHVQFHSQKFPASRNSVPPISPRRFLAPIRGGRRFQTKVFRGNVWHHVCFYRAMLCIARITVCCGKMSVRLSVCHTPVFYQSFFHRWVATSF